MSTVTPKRAIIEFFRWHPRGGDNLLHFSKCSRPFTLRPIKITYINLCFRNQLPEILDFSYKNILLEVIPDGYITRIVCDSEHCLSQNYFLENLISVTQKNVFGIHVATTSDWSVLKTSEAPFLTLRVATLSGAPQAPLEVSHFRVSLVTFVSLLGHFGVLGVTFESLSVRRGKVP